MDDNWRGVRHTAEEMDDYLSKDVALFQEWIAVRECLEPFLNEDARALYSSQKYFWINLFRKNYEEKFNMD